MVNKEQVKHIAKLARLGLQDSEIEKMQKELASILGYIDLLNEVKIEKVSGFFHPAGIENISRKDEAVADRGDAREKIISQFPEKEGEYLKVKEIL